MRRRTRHRQFIIITIVKIANDRHVVDGGLIQQAHHKARLMDDDGGARDD